MGYLIDPAQALALLKESEKHGGHPCTKHIGLSNDQLMSRLHSGEGIRDGSIVYVSTFTTEKDAARAASQALKNVDGGILQSLKEQKKASFTDVRVDEAFKVRFALGGGVKEHYCNHVTLVLFAPPESKNNKFYIKTFYPRPPNELRVNPRQGNT